MIMLIYKKFFKNAKMSRMLVRVIIILIHTLTLGKWYAQKVSGIGTVQKLLGNGGSNIF